MASLITHAALPLIARRCLDVPPSLRRRLDVLAVTCGIIADADWLTVAFQPGPRALLAHRGLFHSLPFAAVFAFGLGLIALGPFQRFTAAWWKGVALLFAAGTAHSLLDVVTVGDGGVALLAPFSRHRYLAAVHLLPVCPLGIPEYFGKWGALVLANEAVFVIAPALLVGWLVRRLRWGTEPRWSTLSKGAIGALAWAAVALSLRTRMPGIFSPLVPRVLHGWVAGGEDDPALIPVDGLPHQQLVTRFEDLNALGLFNRDLVPRREPWSSSFFPFWFGGSAGRWQDSTMTLIARTLFGFHPPTSSQVESWQQPSDRTEALLFGLSPTEKLDLMTDELAFPATTRALQATHNGRPRFWFGLCNGVAAASLAHAEPTRAVDVISPRGRRIRFHPNDVKALLAEAYYWTTQIVEFGGACRVIALDNGAVCSMNPAGTVLATLNRLGIARESFLVDAVPSPRNQYYAVASARVDLVRGPHPLDVRRIGGELVGKVAALVDVRIRLLLASTTLSYSAANIRADGTRYKAVGVVPVEEQYEATLALGPDGTLIGGQWTGAQPDGPDSVSFVTGEPLTVDGGDSLRVNPGMKWPLIRALADASVSTDVVTPTIDLRPPPP